MEKDSSEERKVSSFKAVLMGALATGVNGPTWNALKAAFLMLGVCLAVMMGLAFAGDDPWLTFHVLFLVVIAVALFVLLSCFWVADVPRVSSGLGQYRVSFVGLSIPRFMAQTGLVSVEHQMKELDLVPDDQNQKQKLK